MPLRIKPSDLKPCQYFTKLFNNDYARLGVHVTDEDVHNVLQKFGLDKYISINHGGSMYSLPLVNRLRTMTKSQDFVRELVKRSMMHDEEDEYVPQVSTYDCQPQYKDGENDEEEYSKHLIDMYQYECKKVKITIEQFNRLKGMI
jgi:hypothetical protein